MKKEWCPQHGYPLPCAKCGLGEYAEGVKEMIELVNGCKIATDVYQKDGSLFLRAGDIVILQEYWQFKLFKLKERGLL
uniref:Uncharacterized protein n=1 Tax=viral metagenome TaxID=1070528 RepID=A0A6M3JK07_9ZZZZ